MTKQEFIKWAKSKGWAEDKFGHLKKEYNSKEYRFKIQSILVRYEVKIHHEAGQYSPASNEWMRLRSGYLKDLRIASNGKLSGL